jgi:hypothetical protein
MDSYAFPNNLADNTFNTVQFDFINNNFETIDSPNYYDEDYNQSDSPPILQDLDESTIYPNKNGFSNVNDYLSEPISSGSKQISKYYRENSSELFLPNIETSQHFRNKRSEEEMSSNRTKESFKKMKKIDRKLDLIKSSKKQVYTDKKLAHATAESRYRSSINEQIRKLKTLVAGPNANWKKSAILETVAEYIQQLKKTNSNLIQENLQLKLRLSHSMSMSKKQMSTSYFVVPSITPLVTNCLQAQYSTVMYSCL